MMFSKSELERYSRQLIVPGMGLKGQKRLKKSSTLVVGSGGLGLLYAGFGVGA